MNYQDLVEKTNPFEGLTAEEKQKFIVYLCYVAHPVWTIEKIQDHWNVVISPEERPTVFEALELAKIIQQEIDSSNDTRNIIVDGQETTCKRKPLIFPIVFISVILGVTIVLVVIAARRQARLQEEQARLQEERVEKARKMLPQIDEELGRTPESAYYHYCKIESILDEARCRRHLCETFGIGTRIRSGALLSNCPSRHIHGNCLEVASRSPNFCKSLSFLHEWQDVDSLKNLRRIASVIPALRSSDIWFLSENYDMAMLNCAKAHEKNSCLEKAVPFYVESANNGNVEAMKWLGHYWANKIPLEKRTYHLFELEHENNRKNAIHWFELAASKGGSAELFLSLSKLYVDNSAVIGALQKASRLGNAEASLRLGTKYENGFGVVKNEAEAKRLYYIAANKGNVEAQLKYACILSSLTDAWPWVYKAANQGNVQAQYLCGRIQDFWGWGAWGRKDLNWLKWRCCKEEKGWRDDKCVEPSLVSGEKHRAAAISWYRFAAKNGHEGAERELAKHGLTLE